MTDKKQPKFINARRRGFLQGAAVASGAAITGGVSAGDLIEKPATVAETDTAHKRYELTEHVKKYYAKARF